MSVQQNTKVASPVPVQRKDHLPVLCLMQSRTLLALCLGYTAGSFSALGPRCSNFISSVYKRLSDVHTLLSQVSLRHNTPFYPVTAKHRHRKFQVIVYINVGFSAAVKSGFTVLSQFYLWFGYDQETFLFIPSTHHCKPVWANNLPAPSVHTNPEQPDLHTCTLQVIVEKVSGSQIVDIDKRKYLVPSDITVAQFMWIIRKRIQLPSEKAIFLFVDKTVPQSRWEAIHLVFRIIAASLCILQGQ